MSLSLDEVRIAGLVMALGYAAMAGGAFIPSYRRRQEEAAPVRAAREVPAVIDRLWVGTQGAVMLALLVALVAPQWLFASPTSLLQAAAPPSMVLGTALFLLGCGLVASAAIHLGAELTVAIEAREGGRLVTSGPYARIRHPIYTGVFLIVFGAAVALAAPALAAYGFVAVYCANIRAGTEEELLSADAVHGEAYRKYQSRTGRFFPKLAL